MDQAQRPSHAHINVRAGGNEIDALFERERVVIELDSWTYHGDPVSFRRDRAKDMARGAGGLLPLRLTRDRLTETEAVRLQGILRARR